MSFGKVKLRQSRHLSHKSQLRSKGNGFCRLRTSLAPVDAPLVYAYDALINEPETSNEGKAVRDLFSGNLGAAGPAYMYGFFLIHGLADCA
jgi:hypothetical protein